MVRWGWGLAALLAVTACDDGGDGQGAGGTSGALTDAAAGAPGDATAGGGDLSPVEGDMAADEDMAPGADMSGQGDMMGADPDMMGVDPDMVAPDAGGACPPAGPFGTAVGDVAADLQLPDCDGTLHSVHAECGQPLWIFEFAAWCPPCRQFAGGMEALYTDLGRDGLQAWFIISDTADGGPVDAAFCRQIRNQYGLTMPVLYDAEGAFQATFAAPSNSVNAVLDAAGVLRFKQQFSGAAAVRGAVAGL